MALSDTLEALQRQQVSHLSGERTAEWRHAVGALFENIERWLEVWIRRGLIETEQVSVERDEAGLGHYHVPELRLSCVGVVVVVSPIARLVPDLDGCVDFYRVDRRQDGFHLLWHREPAPEGRWVAVPMRRSGRHVPYDVVDATSVQELLDLVLDPRRD